MMEELEYIRRRFIYQIPSVFGHIIRGLSWKPAIKMLGATFKEQKGTKGEAMEPEEGEEEE